MKRYLELINRYKKDLFGLKYVVGVGYGHKIKDGKRTSAEAIVVLVNKKFSPEKLNKRDLIPRAIEEYRTDVIEVGELKLLRTSRIRPAQPGVSIGHYKISAGTLGAIVRDKKTGELLILSNNHVLANQSNGHDGKAKIGDPILQPGSYDDGSEPDDIIGHLVRFVPIKSKTGESNCPVALAGEEIGNLLIHLFRPKYTMKLFKEEGSNLVDCALAKPISERDVRTDILEIGKVKGVEEPKLGMKVQKSGRTSGFTEGKISVVDTTVEVQMSESQVAVFEDQFITGPISKAGDSGSLVLDMNSNAVGLLFAGSERATVCNKIINVLNTLEVEF